MVPAGEILKIFDQISLFFTKVILLKKMQNADQKYEKNEHFFYQKKSLRCKKQHFCDKKFQNFPHIQVQSAPKISFSSVQNHHFDHFKHEKKLFFAKW